MENQEIDMDQRTPVAYEQKELIELTKNSKGYNWKIRIISDKLIEADLVRLKTFNDRFLKEYSLN